MVTLCKCVVLLVLICQLVSRNTDLYAQRHLRKADKVFQTLRSVYLQMGIPASEIAARRENFIRNYMKYRAIGRITGKTFKSKMNSIELLSDDELEAMFGLVPHFGKKSANKKGGEVEEEVNDILHRNDTKFYIDENQADEVLPTPADSDQGYYVKTRDHAVLGALLRSSHYDTSVTSSCNTMLQQGDYKVRGECVDPAPSLLCKSVTVNRRCFVDERGVPDQFNDWETLGYVGSLLQYRSLASLPGGWAHTASQILDLYQQIYGKQPTTYRYDLINIFHLLNCVYNDDGLSRGSPRAAFNYASNKIVLPRFGTDVFPANCRDMNEECNGLYKAVIDDALIQKSGLVYYKYLYLWRNARNAKDTCDDPETFQPSKNAIPNIMFEEGESSVLFDDALPIKRWVPNLYHASTNHFIPVYGEKYAKPFLFKKGPLAVMMNACYELFHFSVEDGIFSVDCLYSKQRYLAQWVTVASYGPGWFGVLLPRAILPSLTWSVAYPDLLKVSRMVSYTFNYHSFTIPRVKPYSNTNKCKHGGISLNNGRCYCPLGRYGAGCEGECKRTCLNGGVTRNTGCGCNCPNSHYGAQCGKICNCGDYGRCDVEGNCICQRQVRYGEHCEHECECRNYGYCHADGQCECIAGFAGSDCTETCTKKCTPPKVCLYSNSLTDANVKLKEFCHCPYGFYGVLCDRKIECTLHDTSPSAECLRLVTRNRCNSDFAMKNCPNTCGHCLTLNVATDRDS